MALIFNPTSLADWTAGGSGVVEQTAGGTITDGTMEGWIDPFIEFSLDNPENLYIEKDLGGNYTDLVIRMSVELGADFATNYVTAGANPIAFNILELYDNTTLVGCVYLWHLDTTQNDQWYCKMLKDAGGETSAKQILTRKWADDNGRWLDFKLYFRFADDTGYQAVTNCHLDNSYTLNVDSGTRQVNKVRFGVSRGYQANTGHFYLHNFEVHNGRPSELTDFYFNAGTKHFVGAPSIVELTADAGKTVSKVELKFGDGDYSEITVADVVDAASDGVAVSGGILTSTAFEDSEGPPVVTTDSYNGCFVIPKSAPFDMAPACQIVRQREVDGDGRAYLIGDRSWLQNNLVVTFDVTQCYEYQTGKYIVGIDGKKLTAAGTWSVKVTFSDASTADADFTVVEGDKGLMANDHYEGKAFAVGYDDGNTDHPGTFRNVFSGRSERPYYAVMMGAAGTKAYPTFSTWRKFLRAGCTIANHLWDNTCISEHEDEVDADWARDVLAMCKSVERMEGVASNLFVAPGGVFSGATNFTDDVLALWAFGRKSGNYLQAAAWYNDMPIVNDGKGIALNSVGLTNAKIEDDIGSVEAVFGPTYAGGAGDNSFVITTFHSVGNTYNHATGSSFANMIAVLDAAKAHGFNTVTAEYYLATQQPGRRWNCESVEQDDGNYHVIDGEGGSWPSIGTRIGDRVLFNGTLKGTVIGFYSTNAEYDTLIIEPAGTWSEVSAKTMQAGGSLLFGGGRRPRLVRL